MLDPEQLRSLQARAATIHVAPEVAHYVVALAQATREHPGLERGASTRAVLSLTAAARARALWDARDFVIPQDVADLLGALARAPGGAAGRDAGARRARGGQRAPRVGAGVGARAAMSVPEGAARREPGAGSGRRHGACGPRPAGRTYLVLTFGVGLGALNTGNNLLYLVLGLQLSTIIVSGILSERCVRRVQVRRLLPPSPRARTPFHLGWGLRLGKGHSFALAVSEVHPLLGAAVGRLAWLPPGEEVRGARGGHRAAPGSAPAPRHPHLDHLPLRALREEP